MRVAEDLGHSRVVQHGLILVKYRSKELIRETSCVNRRPSHSLGVDTARHLELLTVSVVLTLGPSQPTRGLRPSPSARGTGDTPEAGAPCLQHLSTPALSHSRVTGANTGEQLARCGRPSDLMAEGQSCPQINSSGASTEGITSALILSDATSLLVATGSPLKP